ncbi:BTB/POZ domain [Dillenia turbinata]|uniref:BTB/POZ domain n=1 Tax=Dillenia turbinata TaxID=194707 RepID=A0AAN8V9M2_9MAGN
MKGWQDLGVVDTIYEDEHEDSSTSCSLSPILSSPPTPLHSRIEAWSLARGHKADMVIHVQSTCFHLHKDPLVSKSRYLKGRLRDKITEITLSPPLNVTAEAFSTVVNFCYGAHVVITPFNVAALRTAAALLEMTDDSDLRDGNLCHITEMYFRRAVIVNVERTLIVLRSCLELLPESETTSSLLSRCIEALDSVNGDDGIVCWMDDVKAVRPENFQIIVNSMSRRFTRSHDLLYGFVDQYFEEHNGKITEEQKSQACSSINCNKLSPQILVHAVQNPRMPLRFLVRSMLVEQLNTRCSIVSATSANCYHHHHDPHPNSNKKKKKKQQTDDAITLGAILQRDAALSQVAQLKAAMEATNSRIKSLENDLNGMKNLLHESERKLSILDSKSASFHRVNLDTNRIQREERGSISSGSFRFMGYKQVAGGESFSSPNGSDDRVSNTPRADRKYIGRKLMKGLKSVFRVSKQDSENKIGNKVDQNVGEDHGGEDDVDVVVVRDDRPSHRRSQSSHV